MGVETSFIQVNGNTAGLFFCRRPWKLCKYDCQKNNDASGKLTHGQSLTENQPSGEYRD